MGWEMRRQLDCIGPGPLRPAPEGEALTPGRAGCSTLPYPAAGGAVAKERAGGMQRRVRDSEAFPHAGPAGRAARGKTR
jgi:hypothetical protein